MAATTKLFPTMMMTIALLASNLRQAVAVETNEASSFIRYSHPPSAVRPESLSSSGSQTTAMPASTTSAASTSRSPTIPNPITTPTTSTTLSPTISPPEPQENSTTSSSPLSTAAVIGIATGASLAILLLLAISIFLCRRHRNRHHRLKAIRYIPSDHELLSSTKSPNTVIASSEIHPPRRARTPLPNGLLSPSALDIVRERLELGSMGYGYNRQEGSSSREEVKSVVESLDWDWKKVYVYPYSGRGSQSSLTLGSPGVGTASWAGSRAVSPFGGRR
ncbi:hypothetical protein QBC35DRAFT_135563 [Podospora australis]|uniref:Mid2 domain-containing protein n=1 Tax=Podospora australis TaxID=1536484 RepID=A0AAN6WKA3_9PEZI|nr:hypothetical protein QBC35DRAFT_135563 [Podospora australis]